MFCSACGKPLLGEESFCPHCGAKTSAPTFTATAAANMVYKKPGLHGMAKVWVIVLIILYSACVLANLTNLNDPPLRGWLLSALVLLGLMDFGVILMLLLKPQGFFIQMGAAILLFLLNGFATRDYTLVVCGGLLVFLSWLFTRKQLDYSSYKSKAQEFVRLEGLGKIWVVFTIGYLLAPWLSYITNVSYYYGGMSGFVLPVLLGIAAMVGAVLLLNKRACGWWIMLAAQLIRMVVANSATFASIFSLSFEGLCWLLLNILIDVAPVLLAWVFVREQLGYSRGRNKAMPAAVSAVTFGDLQPTYASAPVSITRAPNLPPPVTPQSQAVPREAVIPTVTPAQAQAEVAPEFFAAETVPAKTPQAAQPEEPAETWVEEPAEAQTEAMPEIMAESPPQITLEAPPTFISKKTEANGGTYEQYTAISARQAQNFLAGKDINQDNYYIVVITPEGNWGKDKLGLYLENLLPWQYEPERAETTARVTPDIAITSLAAAALGFNDNFVAAVICGRCGQSWQDGLRYQNKTLVKCPHCGALNEADTGSIYYRS